MFINGCKLFSPGVFFLITDIRNHINKDVKKEEYLRYQDKEIYQNLKSFQQ